MIDDLIKKAAAALGGRKPFEAERLACEALELAHADGDYASMAAVLPTLERVRRERFDTALEKGTVTILDEPFEEDLKIAPGCYLVQPPLVGADARRLRLLARRRKVPVAVVCREPITSLRLQPLVALSTGVTVRVKIDPPPDDEHPDLEWFADAVLAIGDAAIEGIDPELDIEKRIDTLLARLDAVPEHEGLIRCLAEACVAARETLAADGNAEPRS